MNRAVKIIGGVLSALGLVLVVLSAWHVYIDHKNAHAVAAWVYQKQVQEEQARQRQQQQQQQRQGQPALNAPITQPPPTGPEAK